MYHTRSLSYVLLDGWLTSDIHKAKKNSELQPFAIPCGENGRERMKNEIKNLPIELRCLQVTSTLAEWSCLFYLFSSSSMPKG